MYCRGSRPVAVQSHGVRRAGVRGDGRSKGGVDGVEQMRRVLKARNGQDKHFNEKV